MKRENWNVKSYGFIQQGFCASGAFVLNLGFCTINKH